VSPVILAVAVGIGTSLDFMLPVGTPPNAIAYSTGKVSMSEMIKAGFLLDVAGGLLTVIMAYLVWPFLV
jgi:sodium-dependent dicarboxylate transporter 2/3/5